MTKKTKQDKKQEVKLLTILASLSLIIAGMNLIVIILALNQYLSSFIFLWMALAIVFFRALDDF